MITVSGSGSFISVPVLVSLSALFGLFIEVESQLFPILIRAKPRANDKESELISALPVFNFLICS